MANNHKKVRAAHPTEPEETQALDTTEIEAAIEDIIAHTDGEGSTGEARKKIGVALKSVLQKLEEPETPIIRDPKNGAYLTAAEAQPQKKRVIVKRRREITETPKVPFRFVIREHNQILRDGSVQYMEKKFLQYFIAATSEWADVPVVRDADDFDYEETYE